MKGDKPLGCGSHKRRTGKRQGIPWDFYGMLRNERTGFALIIGAGGPACVNAINPSTNVRIERMHCTKEKRYAMLTILKRA